MSGVKLEGNALGTGVFTIKSPNSNTDRTFDLPDAAGTVMVSGNIPAFSAYQSTGQTLSSSTFTKLQFQTEEFDTANCFDSTTNYRFTPNVAGYYQVNARAGMATTNCSNIMEIWKNGARYKRGNSVYTSAGDGTSVNILVYLNGTTDYIEAYYWLSTGQGTASGVATVYFQASMVRAA